MATCDVFLSLRFRKDPKAKAKAIQDRLEERGLTVFIANQLPGGNIEDDIIR